MKLVIKRVILRLLTNIQVRYYKFISVGKNFRIVGNCSVSKNTVEIGDHCFINKNCSLTGYIKLGNFVMLAESVAMVGGDHNSESLEVPMIFAGRDKSRRIIVGDDVWIGHGAIIMHGVTIGDGAIIGAGSIVTKNIPPYSIAVGSPAKILRSRFSEKNRLIHEEMLKKYRDNGALNPKAMRTSSSLNPE